MLIYTVIGSTGEYSDRTEWPVISYSDEAKAQEHVLNADRKAKEWEAIRESSFEDPPEEYREYDQNMQMDYTGTYYYYITTELI